MGRRSRRYPLQRKLSDALCRLIKRISDARDMRCLSDLDELNLNGYGNPMPCESKAPASKLTAAGEVAPELLGSLNQ